ncbi:MAG: hypothetical protein GX823_01570, partial [Clostridiales bacterium]|nr:hypothetical protein [Clostridiales bacterium]
MAEAAVKQDRYVYSNPLPENTARAGAVPRAIPIPRPAYRPRLSAFAVVGFLFIAFLTVVCVYSQIELTKISAEITGVRAVPPKVEAQTGIIEKLNGQIADNNALSIE